MTNLEAASTLVELYGELAQLQKDRGCSTVPEYTEAIAIAIMALNCNSTMTNAKGGNER
jgi:hypothetical protein